MDVTLSDGERTLILELLNHALGELKSEIRRSSTHEFQDQLKDKEQLMSGLIGRLS